MGSNTVKDDHVRYEVSFAGKDKVEEFVDFIKVVCYNLQEESIYLTMGENSFLITPKPKSGTKTPPAAR